MIANAGLLMGVIIVTLVLIMLIGWWAGKKTSGFRDFMVAEGKMPFWLTTATLLATFICGGTVMGGAGTAYNDGLQATIPDPFGAALCLIAGGAFYLSLIRKTGAVSAGSVYKNRYGAIGAAVASLCMVPTFVFFAGSQVAAGAKLFRIMLGFDFFATAMFMGIFVIVYTVMGGIKAVAWTDFVQIGLLVLGVLCLFPMTLIHLNSLGGHAAAVELMGRDFFSFGLLGDYSFTGIATYFALWVGTSAGAVPGCDVIQRGLVAKTPRTAKWSGIVSGVIMVLIGLMVVYIGAWSNLFVEKGLLSPEQVAAVEEDAELLIPLLTTKLMPSVLTALFFVGLIGAIMSSADSALFAPATILSNDLIRPWFERIHKPYTEKDLTRWTRYSVIFLGILATILGGFTQSVFDLMVVGFTVQVVLFFPLTLALYWKGANKTGAVAGMVTGMALVLGMMLVRRSVAPEPYWFLTFGPMLIALAVQIIVSRVTAKTDPPLPLTHEDGSIIKWPELAR
jgi:SSS family transporter